jgi:cytoskeletal protein CcmA (bactofilin family)
MFGRKKDDEEAENQLAIPGEGETAAQLRQGAKPTAAAAPARHAPVTTPKPEPRRAPEHPATRHATNGNGANGAHGSSGVDPKRLIVGRDIVLTGAIHSCDKLQVEGRVEATLTDCREMEITESGTFKGEASVDVAVISGRFEGTLIARELLLIRAKGSVTGTVRFARLEVERGGEIEGGVSVVKTNAEPTTRAIAGNGAGVHAPEEAAAN